MSEYSIKQYLSEVEKIIHFGGTKKETAIRNAFYNLLNEYAKGKGLMVVPEVSIKTPAGKTVTPDGTLKDSLRQDWGYWESKDEADIIDDEIKKKFDRGYPKENILFEDSQTAVLFQNGIEIMRVKMRETAALDKLLTFFVNFERPEVTQFRKAIELFKQDIPKVTETIRGIIIAQENTNPKFVKASAAFLKICHDSINPDITIDDVREMMIQHILTEDIFNTIFDEVQFHRENNIARELEKVIITFFTGNTKRVALSTVQHYYQAINAAASGIADHHEKQKFLKVVYETFYKSYNPKAADRLGVVYTPNEIVRFMVESTDYLLNMHFGKSLEDKGVDILDPATGTGTFICDIIDFIRKDKVDYKYQNELHANEVAILPYYISNLNIEYTFKQKTGNYREFESLCFVDTLENLSFLYRGKQGNLFDPFTEENSKRIKRQNDKRISVIIGNPPYNANQLNENENNKNREYSEIDKRIRETYIKESTAQKTKLYDMYARFLRWASDRIDENAIIAFVSNNSFIDSRSFDGFRKTLSKEFNYCYIINLKGNARTSGEQRKKEGGNIFKDQIRVGVSIYFLIKKNNEKQFELFYNEVQDYATAEEKLNYLVSNNFTNLSFEKITPDKRNNWLGAESDFLQHLELINKETKSRSLKETALFRMTSLGVVTARDEWVLDYNKENLERKVNYLIDTYNADLRIAVGKSRTELSDVINYSIKWSRAVKNDLSKGKVYEFIPNDIVDVMYRPYTIKKLYFNKSLNEMQYQLNRLYKPNQQNPTICVTAHSQVPFCVQASYIIFDYGYGARDTKSLSLYDFDSNGNKVDNITDWGLTQFKRHYKRKNIIKEDIFYYVYAVLHNPSYLVKYSVNLQHDFPRLPFYSDFDKWVKFGRQLFDLHGNFTNQLPYEISIININNIVSPKAILRYQPELGVILLDENTEIRGIPIIASKYKLGYKSAIDWVLDQHKESKPKDPTIAEKFNTYKFADYKEHVIDLIKRVCTVSVETMKVINEMKAAGE